MTFSGFPRKVRFTPVPGPLFGPLIEQIDDLAELKCTLRVIWLLHEKKGYPRFVTLRELLADRTLVKALSAGNHSNTEKIMPAMEKAVERGTFAKGTLRRKGMREQLYMLNTEQDRNAMARIVGGGISVGILPQAEPWEEVGDRPNIFALYEDNIGMLSPMIVDELREAEQFYHSAWIEDAFREAVGQNKRSWRYIARILEKWSQEGRGYGESGGHSKKSGYQKEYLRQ